MSDIEKKAKKVVTGLAAAAMAVEVHVDTDHGEVDKFALFGVPLFWREPHQGNPRLVGIPFPRWIRGPRK